MRLNLAALALLTAGCTLLSATAVASGAKTSTGSTLFPTIDLPLHPDSPVRQRLQHHRHEARARSWVSGAPGGLPGGAVTAADFANLPKTTWQLVHQDITVDVVPAKSRISVDIVATVRTQLSDLSALTFRTDDIEGVQVRDATGAPLKSSYKKVSQSVGLVTVSLPTALTAAVDTEVEVSYEAKLKCDGAGFRLKPCHFDNTYSSVAFFRYYLGHGQAIRHPFTSDLHVITPHNRKAAAPGIAMGATKLADGRLSWRFKQPERTQNAGFSIANYGISGDSVSDTFNGKPHVRVYSQGKYASNGKHMVNLARDVMTFAAARFGDFPWAGINIIQMAQNFGGGYAPLSGIFMMQYVFGTSKGSQGWTSTVELTAHEMAHQWWGNFVRPATHHDTSLSESLAEFTSCLFTEKVLKSRGQIIGDNLSYVYTVKDTEDRPLGSVYAHSSPKYVQIMYHKGAVVMDMLRIELGEQVWLDALKAFTAKYGRDYARWQNLSETVNDVTGKNLGWYFQQWFAKTGYIRGEITTNLLHDDNGSTLKLRFAHLGKEKMRFRLPIRVTFADRTKEDTHIDIVPEPSSHLSVATRSFAKKVVSVRPDLGRRLLRRFQLLTPGDVDLNGLADGRDLIEIGFRARRGVVYTAKNGKQHFYPNALWDELFDVVPNYVIDTDDIDAVAAAIGTTSIDF